MQGEGASEQAPTIVSELQTECLCEPGGAPCEQSGGGIRGQATVLPHGFETFFGLARPQ